MVEQLPPTQEQVKMRKWLAAHFCPTVLTFSSQSAYTKFDKQNNLTPAEFLRPFSDVGPVGGYKLNTSDKNPPV